MKVNVKNHTMMYPAPAVVASAYDEKGNADACTLAFATMCSTLKRKTLKSILHSGEFCLAFGSVEQVCEVDYLGIESGYSEDKLSKIGFTHQRGQKVNAPIINEFKLSLECRVMHIAEVGSHTQITGEIVNVQAESDIVDDNGRIIFEKVNPIAYDDITHSYFSMGEKIGDAFNLGLKFRK